MLETLSIKNNPNLVYIHPQAIQRVPSLTTLELNNNNLTILEDIRPQLPRVTTLKVSGNSFFCHCSSSWIANIDPDVLDCSICDNKPYILPLFPSQITLKTGDSVNFSCDTVPRYDSLSWKTGNLTLPEDTCHEHYCVTRGSLIIPIVTVADQGRYTCVASNQYGSVQRSVQLVIQPLNILLFPISVASTFLTISWNISQSFTKDLLLQVQQLDHNYNPTELPQTFSKLDVGHKMNSYTIPDLVPSTHYILELFLTRNSHQVKISSLLVTTKQEDYIKEYGIRKNYSAIILLATIVGLLVTLCVVVMVLRICRIKNISQLTSSSSNILLSPANSGRSSRSQVSSSQRTKQSYKYRASPQSKDGCKNYSDKLLDNCVTSST